MTRKDDILDDDLEKIFESGIFDEPEESVAEATEATTAKEEKPAEEPKAKTDEIDEDIPGQLAVDVYETEDKLIIKARTPGVKKSDLTLNISKGVLKIHGQITNTDEIGAVKWWANECYWGEFDREIVLPVQVIEDAVEAVLRDGVLTISFEKIDLTSSTVIQIL